MSDEAFNQRLAQVLGLIIGVLGIAGLFTKGYLWGITNSDLIMDLFRIMAAVALLYVGFGPALDATTAATLRVIGIIYLIIGIGGLLLPTLLGLLPSGLTRFDIFYHLVFGAIATWAGSLKTSDELL